MGIKNRTLTEQEIEAKYPDRCRYTDCYAKQIDQAKDKYGLHLCRHHTRLAHDLLELSIIRKQLQFDREHDHNRKKRKPA